MFQWLDRDSHIFILFLPNEELALASSSLHAEQPNGLVEQLLSAV